MFDSKDTGGIRAGIILVICVFLRDYMASSQTLDILKNSVPASCTGFHSVIRLRTARLVMRILLTHIHVKTPIHRILTDRYFKGPVKEVQVMLSFLK